MQCVIVVDAEKKVSDKQEKIERETEENRDTEKNIKTEVSTKEFISFAKKREVLYRLTLRRGYDDYYSAEVNAVIDYILGKEDRLNEKFIDELSKKCSIEGCITKGDRKEEGDAIIEAAKKWFEKSNQIEVSTKKFISLAKKEKVLLYLESHQNGNSYSQEVRDKIAFILKNKNLLDEKLIDELYDACLRKACFNEEDRKRKGEAIVGVADKICEKSKEMKEKTDESEENTENTQTVVVKEGRRTKVGKRVPDNQKKMVEKIENNVNVPSLTPKGDIAGDRDNSKKRVSAVEEHGEASVAQEDWTDRNFAKSEVFSLTGNQQDFNLEGDNQTSHFGK